MGSANKPRDRPYSLSLKYNAVSHAPVGKAILVVGIARFQLVVGPILAWLGVTFSRRMPLWQYAPCFLEATQCPEEPYLRPSSAAGYLLETILKKKNGK